MRRLLPILFAAVLAACAPATPTLQTGPEVERTYDGLVPVANARFAEAWARPDVDWARYTKIMVAQAQFQFRAAREMSATAARRNTGDEFAISDANRAKLISEVTSIFREELARSERFTVVSQPGPDVLLVSGALLDIVSRVPPDMPGRGDIYLDRVGEATLVLQLQDAMSGEVLARAAERRAAERAGGSTMSWSTPVSNWAEVRRLARRWAVKLREGLDSFPR